MSQVSLTKSLNSLIIRAIEAILSLGVKYPDAAFYGHKELPWLAALERRTPSIEVEGARVLERYKQLMDLGNLSQHQSEIDAAEGWKVFFLTGYGFSTRSAQELCPDTLEALKQVPDISSAIFSILAPGKRIALHRGMYKGLGRAHLAIKVPENNQDCWLEVDKKRRPWVKGEAFGFEDAWEHEVQNNTDEYRIVLLITFERPMKGVFAKLNKAFLGLVKKSKYVRETKARYDDWEETNWGESAKKVDALS